MAGEAGLEKIDLSVNDEQIEESPLIGELLRKPGDFSYFQALRMLLLYRAKGSSLASAVRESLLVRADPSLAFPAFELVEVEGSGGAGGPGPVQ